MIGYKPELESWLNRKSASTFVARITDRHNFYNRCITDPALQWESANTSKAIMGDIADYMYSQKGVFI